MRLPSSASNSPSSSPSSPGAKLPTMTTKSSRRRTDKETPHFKTAYPLQRGSACLSCRKRKMKCDAGKPACGQCVKANRSADCDYDDGKSKSRTQLLQEKISALETRLRELEGSSPSLRPTPPSLQRFHSTPADPANPNHFYSGIVGMIGGAGEGGGNGSTSSFELTSLSNNGSPTPRSPSDSAWLSDQYDLRLGHHEFNRVATPDDLPWDVDPLTLTPQDLLKVSGRWWEHEVLPPRIQQLLIDIFMPHRQQCGFEVNLARFQSSLSSSEPPHPALLNAIYALACHFSLSPILTPHESRFVARALSAVSSALEASDRLVQVLQASCLLAVLFFAKGRLLEGYYHAGAAARLAVGLGLHQIATRDWTASPGSGSGSSASSESSSEYHGVGGSSILPPPVDSAELGERILAFWQVFNLDRCWAVATGLPVALPEDSHPRTRIETVWPRSLEEYDMGHVSGKELGSVHYLNSQVANIPYPSHESTNALRAKATTLFERAARLSSSFGSMTPVSEQFWVEFQNADASIARLTVSLPSVRVTLEDQTTRTQMDTSLFVVHALLHAATIQLHSSFAFKDPTSQQKSAAIAALATSLVHELDDSDYAFLDPIMGTCWTSVAEALLRQLIVMRGTPSAEQQVGVLNRQLDVVVMAMNRLGTTVPLAAYQASKVEQSRRMTF